MRRAIFQVHLWSGIGLALYILVICASGSAIVFRRDLDKTLCPPDVTVHVGPHRLSTAELTSKAHARYPRFDSSRITIGSARAANAPVEVLFSGRGVQLDRLFDPYTGEDLADAIGCEPPFVTSLAAFHDHLVQCFVEVSRPHHELAAVVRSEQRSFAQQLADERRARARGALDVRRDGRGHVQTATIQLEQPPPALGIGHGHLDGLIDSAGARGERGLEEVRAIRREHEQDVGVVREAVHLIQQLE